MTLEGGAGFRLSRVARVRRRLWAQQLESLGLTPAQASILRGASDNSQQSLRSLARTLGTDAMSVKRCADELETRGLISSGTAPDDRRPRVVNLTKSGRKLVGLLDEMVARQEENLRSFFPANEYKQLLVVLGRLEEGLQISEIDEKPKKGREMMNSNETSKNLGEAWDRRYVEHGWSQVPDEALVGKVTGLKPGLALDLGCGTGRNSIWLARQGWNVTGVDASAVGLKVLSDQAASEGLHLTTEQVDLLTFQPDIEFYDLVVIANIHLAPEGREKLFDRAAAAVKTGGHLYIIGHHVDVFGKFGPPILDHLYDESIFRNRFSEFSIETLERRETLSDIDQSKDVSMLLWARKNEHIDGGER